MNFFPRTETACARLLSDAGGHLYRLECLECLDSNTLDATAHGNREIRHSRFNAPGWGDRHNLFALLVHRICPDGTMWYRDRNS